jgi:hypothetical protein
VFSILDRYAKLCDGIPRRELLRIGGLSALGLTLPKLIRAIEAPPPGIIEDPTFGRAKNVIYVWLQGGPPQHETFDPKPDAPAEVRGPFRPIQTNVAGIQFSELLPRTARIADKLAVIRSMATDSNIHSVSAYEVLTGYKYRGPNARQISPNDWPYFGSLVKRLKPSEKLPPLTTAWLPDLMRLNENVTPAGQTAGFMGSRWDPDRFVGDPSLEDYKVEGLGLDAIPPMRLKRRMALLDQVQRHFGQWRNDAPSGVFDEFQHQAFDLLNSGRVQQAFRVGDEPPRVRERYGRHTWGQCLLLARRLVEVGVRLVHVNWTREPGDSAVDNPMWDTHAQNADRVEDVLCPMFDVGFTALIEDLDQRGLLDETLVVAIGEFGRTPRINAQAGRDHWGSVFSFAMAGAGIQTGQVYGASDRIGGHPAADRVTPADLTATIFHALGIHHDGKFDDAEGREHQLTTGTPLRGILGSSPARPIRRVAAGGDLGRVPPFHAALLRDDTFHVGGLLACEHGSRPKGWRAGPLLAAPSLSEPLSAPSDAPPLENQGLGVWLIPRTAGEQSASEPAEGPPPAHLALGLRVPAEGESLHIAQGARALLAQEMRNPRLGNFKFTIHAAGQGTDRRLWDEVLSRHFAFRLVIFRYAEATKNPHERQEFISLPFVPEWRADDALQAEAAQDAAAQNDAAQSASRDDTLQADAAQDEALQDAAFQTQPFSVEKLLDSPAPGQNFPIGNGFGVAVVLEKVSPGTLELEPTGQAAEASLRIEHVELDFRSRRINEKVQV